MAKNNLRHYFVPALDVSEKVPFTVSLTRNAKKDMSSHDNAKKYLSDFVSFVEKSFGEKLIYIGMDVIGEKYYERFLFEKGGFLEIMMEAPLAINAHFSHKARAKKFETAIKKAFSKLLDKDSVSKMFIESISFSSDDEENIKVSTWGKLKNIRK